MTSDKKSGQMQKPLINAYYEVPSTHVKVLQRITEEVKHRLSDLDNEKKPELTIFLNTLLDKILNILGTIQAGELKHMEGTEWLEVLLDATEREVVFGLKQGGEVATLEPELKEKVAALISDFHNRD